MPKEEHHKEAPNFAVVILAHIYLLEDFWLMKEENDAILN